MKKKHHIALDLDGTLLQYSGWKRESRFGKPYKGAKEFVETLISMGHRVTVFTAREKHEPVKKHLKKFGFPPLDVTNIKRHDFSIIVDDRAMNYHGSITWHRLIYRIEDFKPWWKSPKVFHKNPKDVFINLSRSGRKG